MNTPFLLALFLFPILSGDIVLAMNSGLPTNRIAGIVIDDSGRPMTNVDLTIVAKSFVNLEPVREKTNLLITSAFALSYPDNISEISLIAQKDGYALCSVNLDKHQLNSTDIVMTLVSAPPKTSLIQVELGKMTVDPSGLGSGLILDLALCVPLDKRPEIYLRPVYAQPYTSGMRPISVYLHMVEGGGLSLLATNNPPYVTLSLFNGVEAPSENYIQEIEFPIAGDYPHLLYFRTTKGLYGKMRIDSFTVMPDTGEITMRVGYFFQPDGSRNLNNGQRLKLIRAKKVE